MDRAYATLHNRGLRVSVPALPAADPLYTCDVVGTQTPRAGRSVAVGTVVSLRLALAPRCGLGSPALPVGQLPSAVVPNLVGQPVSALLAWSAQTMLYWAIEALPPACATNADTLYDNYRIIAQHPAPGTTLTLGTGAGGAGGASFTPTPLTVRGTPLARFSCPDH